MNWEAVGALAEAIGVIAIFVSLIYVAVQIRQNTQQISRTIEADRLAAFERNVESGNHHRELLILHPDLLQLLLKGYKSYKKLAVPEKARFGLLIRNMFSGMQGAYIRHLSLEHDPQDFEGSARMLDDILLHRGVREWLDRSDLDWRPEFRDFIDQRLEATRQE
jgi:hypothetical protein